MDKLDEIYAEYDSSLNTLDIFILKGKDGFKRIAMMMESLRTDDSPFADTKAVIDYNNYVDAEPCFGKLPISNVLKYILKDGSGIAVRPSGTELKIKIYYSVKDPDYVAAEKKLTYIRNTIKAKLGLE